MKKIATVILAFAVGACFAQDAVKTPSAPQPQKGTNYVKGANLKATGGFAVKPIEEGAKQVILLDARKDTAKDGWAAFTKKLERLRLPYKKVAGTVAAYDNKNGDAVIALVDGGDFCVYPNKLTAVIPTGEDAATLALMEKGLITVLSTETKEINDMVLMRAAVAGAKNHGIKPQRRALYVVACEEGWAPAPTNDIQKAVWDKVQAEKANANAKPAEAPATPTAK